MPSEASRRIRFTVRFDVNKRQFVVGLAALIILGVAYAVRSSTLTLTTIYPAPSGVYRALITTGGTTASPANTVFARDAGKVGVGTGTLIPTNPLTVSNGYTGQTNALIAARGNGTPNGWPQGNAFEWGHANPAGYENTLGNETNSGRGFLCFNCEAGSTTNTYLTRGVSGALFRSNNDGGFQFSKISGAAADNQTPTDFVRIDGNGNVGIGTAAPAAKLHVVGGIQMVDGNQAAGKVLTSDANGLASWASPAGVKTFTGVTSGYYDGMGVGGYVGGDAKCATQYGAGARMCTAADLAYGRPTSRAWYNTFEYNSNGSNVANDCNSWTTNSSAYFGTSWQPSPGYVYLTSCDTSTQLRIACCK